MYQANPSEKLSPKSCKASDVGQQAAHQFDKGETQVKEKGQGQIPTCVMSEQAMVMMVIVTTLIDSVLVFLVN